MSNPWFTDVDPGDETAGNRHGDLCERCAENLAVPDDDFCRSCIEEIEPLLDALESLKPVGEELQVAVAEWEVINEWLNGDPTG